MVANDKMQSEQQQQPADIKQETASASASYNDPKVVTGHPSDANDSAGSVGASEAMTMSSSADTVETVETVSLGSLAFIGD